MLDTLITHSFNSNLVTFYVSWDYVLLLQLLCWPIHLWLSRISDYTYICMDLDGRAGLQTWTWSNHKTRIMHFSTLIHQQTFSIQTTSLSLCFFYNFMSSSVLQWNSNLGHDAQLQATGKMGNSYNSFLY